MKRLRLRRRRSDAVPTLAPQPLGDSTKPDQKTGRREHRPAPSKPAAKINTSDPKPVKAALPLSPLSFQEQEFVRHYIATNNGTRSAIAAGYSKRSASTLAARLLTKVRIATEITRLRAEKLEKLDITADMVISELGKIAFANMLDFIEIGPDGTPRTNFANLTRMQAAALAEITVEEFMDGRSDQREVRRVKFKKHDKHAALDTLAKHFGLLVEKHDHHLTVTLAGALLDEIDAEARQGRTIEATALPAPGVASDG